MKKYPNRANKQPEWERKLRLVFSFPHTWICVVIVLFAIVSLIISCKMNSSGNSFCSSIFSNIFAGLVTGFVICLMSSAKQIYVVILQEKKAWLEKLAEMIRQYSSDHYDLLHLHFDKFDGDENKFNLIYDCGSHANWINDEIVQSSFSKILSFNSIKYCKKHLSYDAKEMCDPFSELHEKLQMIDVDCPSSAEILGYFDFVDHKLGNLNSGVHRQINLLKIRLSAIQKSII